MDIDETQTVTIRVDDTGAQYPVLIDPWLQHPSSTAPVNKTGAKFGFSVAYCERWRPDFGANGDYQGSLIIGAPYYDDGLVGQGKIWAFSPTGSGTNTSFSVVYFEAKGEFANANFGYSLAVAQPFDLPDGGAIKTFQEESPVQADLVVGSPGASSGAGRAYVYYGANSITHPFGTYNRTANRIYGGVMAGENLGLSVAVGDVTGDGYQDLLIGRPNYASGEVNLYKSTSTGLPGSITTSIFGSSTGEQFGWAIAVAGDVNHNNPDGQGISLRDVLVGAPNYNGARGRVFLFDGTASGMATTAYWTNTTANAGCKFGYAVAGNGDIDDVNNKDFVVGAPFYDGNATDGGAVFVYRSNSSGSPMAATILQPPTAQSGSRLGYAVTLGDMDKDLTQDIIAGAPWYDKAIANDDKGRVFVFFGASNSAPGSRVTHAESPQSTPDGEHFGSSVTYIFKISDPINDNRCFAAGAPEAKPLGVTGAGLVGVYELAPPYP